uniref:dopamine beta-hydroxylase-like n=1 Tax=Panthera onca TaxID=9690 RepID=UPI002953C244|nr:dopamine beta-hydroxylase-like [Panthera onca]
MVGQGPYCLHSGGLCGLLEDSDWLRLGGSTFKTLGPRSSSLSPPILQMGKQGPWGELSPHQGVSRQASAAPGSVSSPPLPPQYEPIVTKGNEALVHHMEVFQCAPQFETFPQFSGPCDSKMKPGRLDYCRHVLAAWALGAKAFYYPEEAGLAFGGAESSRFLRLEVHYHNPLKIQGRDL